MLDRRLKVLRLANFVSPTSGGIRTVLRRISHAQADLGVHSTIVVPGPDAGIAAVEGVLDVGTLPGVRLAAGQPYRLVLNRTAIRAVLDEVRPDVVEIHDQLTLAWLGKECRRRGIRTVLVAHERLDLLAAFWSGLDVARTTAGRWIGRVGKQVDQVVTPSDFAAIPYRAAGIDVRVVRWGVDHAVFTPEGQRARGGEGVLRLVHAGRLSAEKDPTLSARTAEYLAQRGTAVALTVVGSGPQAPLLAAYPHARMVGFLDGADKMAQALRSADVFLAPGPFETFGVSALEAMACGLPVVCRESGSISEIPGTLSAPGSPEGFGQAALALAADRDARSSAAAFAESYTWDAAARQMRAVYEK